MDALYLSETLALYYPDAQCNNLENHNMNNSNISINITALNYKRYSHCPPHERIWAENRDTSVLNLGN